MADLLRVHHDDWRALLSRAWPNVPGARAGQLAPEMARWLPYYEIDSPQRVAHWLAQTGHESGEGRWVQEIWGPTPAQVRYEGRRDLGNTQPGDGYTYRGRGLIQITGRANYAAAAEALDVDLIDDPARAVEPELAVRIAGWYWASGNPTRWSLNRYADRDDLIGLTRRINGGTNGLTDRRRLYGLAVEAVEWAEVRLLQRRLNAAIGAGLALDGAYGGMTREAVRGYQRARDLVPDGIAGPRTWAALDGEAPVND